MFQVDTVHIELLSQVEGYLLGQQFTGRPPLRSAHHDLSTDRPQTWEPQLLQVQLRFLTHLL